MLTQSYAFGSSEVDNTLKQAEVHVLAQKGYIVKGIVKDQLGEPLGGVSIVVKGTTVGTTTDLDGNFTLNVPANNVTLAFSFIGFKSQEVALKGQTDLNIVLSEDTEMLDEVVVVGYGSMKRSDVATAISSVKPEDMNLAGANSRDVRQLLDGKVAGLSITRTNGSNPNNGVAVQMRGVVSVNGDIAPLVVIDGIPGGNLDLLRSEDIESIDVLKDGSAAAIYGSRANAGVILITTKRGSKGKTSVDYSTYLTHYWGVERPDFMNATDWRNAMSKFNNPSYMTDRGSDTDWFDTLLKKGNVSHSHNLSISGGGESTLYRASLYYSDLEGIGKATDREQYGGRMSLETRALNNMLTFQTNLSLNYGNMNLLGGDGEWESALRSNPTNPIYNEDGTYYEDYAKDENKVARLNQQQYDKQQTTSSFDGKLIFEPIKDLKGSIFVSYTRDDQKERRFYDVDSRISYNDYNSGGYAWKKSYMKTTQTFEPTIEYTKTFLDNHKINAIAGYSYQYQVYEQFEAHNNGFLNNSVEDNNLGSGSGLNGDASIKAGMGSKKELAVIEDLPLLSEEEQNTGRFTRAAGYAMLATLYLNAEVWTGTPRWDDCITYCDKLIKGEGGAAHGTMELDKDLVSTYSKDNSTDSKEHILSLTYDYLASGLYCGWSGDFYHFNQKYINGGIANGNDGIVVIPSAYDAFADNDLRKKEWMLIGPQYDYKTGEPVVGTSEYSGQPLVFVKDIKRFSEGKTDESTMYTGEENSGARFDKYKTGASGDPNYWGNDWVLYRLTEIYFDKAEALMRKNGGKATQDAVDLINACRQRAFSAEDWENAKYSVATLTMDELLAERGREFIFEGKRRTDLIRFDKFGTGDWWDGKNSDEHYEIFPIPYQQATLNPNLDQNPGYNQ